MNDAINLNTDKAIRKLMERSTWGRANNIRALTSSLQDEFDELTRGIERNDIANCFEESADVLMLVLCILYRLSDGENEEYTTELFRVVCKKLHWNMSHEDVNRDVDEAIRQAKSLPNIKDNFSDQELLQSGFKNLTRSIESNDVADCFEQTAVFLLAVLSVLNKLSPDESAYVAKILNLLNEKLFRRYKPVLDDSSNIASFDIDTENYIWREAKKKEQRTDLMYCPNVHCNKYCDIATAEIDVDGDTGYCRFCEKHFRITRSCILLGRYQYKREYLSILADAVVAYNNDGNVALSSLINGKLKQRKAYKALQEQIIHNVEKTLAFTQFMKDNHSIEARITQRFIDIAKTLPLPAKRNAFTEYYDSLRNETTESLKRLSASDMKTIRRHLAALKEYPVENALTATLEFSARGWNRQVTRKLLLQYQSKRVIECMAIIHYNCSEIRDLTFELSNMYGCPVKCAFCASGALTEDWIMMKSEDYVRQINTLTNESSLSPNEFVNFYVSFAGIGEPSLLGKEVSIGMRLLTNMYPHVQFNIATIGIRPQSFTIWQKNHNNIRTIQIPYFSTKDDELRRIAMNLPNDYDLAKVISSALSVKETNPNCRFKINYIVICGYNDSDDAVEKLCSFLTPWKHLLEIKISYLNETEPSVKKGFSSPSTERMNEIHAAITEQGFTAYVFGTTDNHGLGCGQLAQGHLWEGKTL